MGNSKSSKVVLPEASIPVGGDTNLRLVSDYKGMAGVPAT